jgi:hypothetical protein
VEESGLRFVANAERDARFNPPCEALAQLTLIYPEPTRYLLLSIPTVTHIESLPVLFCPANEFTDLGHWKRGSPEYVEYRCNELLDDFAIGHIRLLSGC